MRVVITGANRGLGLGLARAFAERGDEVWATARRPGEARELQALAKASEGRVHVHEVDVRKDDQIEAFAAAVGDAPVDVLVNNAGVASPWSQGLMDFDAEEAMRCFDTNALGAIRMTRALVLVRFRDSSTSASGRRVMSAMRSVNWKLDTEAPKYCAAISSI